MPTANQILGAEIRAAQEAWFKRNRRPYRGGGYTVPSRARELAFLGRKFGMTPVAVSYFLTYSRECTHPWSAGACDRCPV